MRVRLNYFLIPMLLGITLISSNTFAQKDIAVPDMENYLLLNGVNLELCHRAKSYQNLINLFETQISFCEEDSKYEESFLPDKDYGIHTHLAKIERDDKEGLMSYLETGRQILLEHKDLPSEDVNKKYACLISARLLYTFISLAHIGDGRTHKETRKILKSLLIPNRINYPYSLKKFEKEIIGKNRSKKESKFLQNNELKDLAQMSAKEISLLDIREDDPFYYSDAYIKDKTGDEMAKGFNEKIYGALTKWLRKKHGDERISYRSDAAPKTLFLKKIKGVYQGAGNNPKFKTFDHYKVDYKIKLGKERAAEAIVNYLHLAIGGKFSDINFLHTYQNPLVVVFHPKTKENEAKYLKLLMGEYNPPEIEELCSKIDSYKMFKLCFEKSRYQYKKMDTFVLKHGIITQKNVRKLVKFDDTPVKEFKDVLGREYMIMKEASTELKNDKIFQTASGIAASTIGANDLRSIKSHGLFEMFVDNFDAKDLNFKGVVLNPKYFPELADKSSLYRYMEYPSDTGSALARFFFSFHKRNTLNRNTFPVTWQENKFVNNNFLIEEPPFGEKLLYNNTCLYAPYSWENATSSDNEWIARRIVNKLTDEVITNAVNQTNMPDMWRMNMINRLIKRRDQIAHFFKLDLEKRYEVSKKIKLDMNVSLRTLEERKIAAKRYQISLKEIHKEMIARKIINNKKDTCDYQDPVLKKGFVSPPKHSVINSILDKLYPSGIGY